MEGQDPEPSLEEEAGSAWSGPGNHACGHVQQHCLSRMASGPAFGESSKLTTLTAPGGTGLACWLKRLWERSAPSPVW